VINKKKTLIYHCEKKRIDLAKVIYIGNDINDLEAMKLVGYPLAPSDASQSIKDISKILFNSKGGQGVIRELLDRLA